MKTIAALCLSWALVVPAGAQECTGDANRDEVVTVDEILTAVTNALDGCPVANACPVSFNHDNNDKGSILCIFAGKFPCGATGATAIWASDGHAMIAKIRETNPPIYFYARVKSATLATIEASFSRADFSDMFPVNGLLIMDNGGDAFVIAPTSDSWTIGGCKLGNFAGAYTSRGTVATESVEPSEQKHLLQMVADIHDVQAEVLPTPTPIALRIREDPFGPEDVREVNDMFNRILHH